MDGDGYGMLSSYEHHGRRTKKYVHRWVWEMARGPIPKGMVIRHRCDNRVCFRLSHLEIGTVADNNRDAQERGHLGSVRVMPPSVVREIWARRSGGEKWVTIIPDYPDYSPATVKRVKDYICDISTSTDSPASGPTRSDAGALNADENGPRLPDGTRVVHSRTPTSTTRG